jgi:C-terminal processing protease CtpA/Prc
LPVAAPRTPEELEAEYNKMYLKLAKMYVEPARLTDLHFERYRTKYKGQIKTWNDLRLALRDLWEGAQDHWTNLTDGVEKVDEQIVHSKRLLPFGAMLHEKDDHTWEIEYITKSLAADLGGLQERDEIVSFDGLVLKDQPKEVVEKLLLKPTGTTVTVVSRPRGESETVTKDYTFVKPDKKALEPVFEVLADGAIVYMRLPDFMHPEVWEKLKISAYATDAAGGLQIAILDLRNNSGGLVPLAKDMIETFVDPQSDKPLTYLKERMRTGPSSSQDIDQNAFRMPEILKREYSAAQLGAMADLRKIKLYILVNGSTVSAPEIVGARQGRLPAARLSGRRAA